MEPTLTSGGGADAFVAKFDGDDNYVWGKQFGGIDYDGAWGVITDSQRSVYFTGTWCGPVDFGGGTMEAQGTDTYIAKLDANGKHVWSHCHGFAGTQNKPHSVALEALGSAWIIGIFDGTIDFGAGPLKSDGQTDTYIARFAP